MLLKSAGDIVLKQTSDYPDGDYTGNELQGVDVSTPQASGITYYVLSKPAADKAFGFYKLADGTNLAANKAYLVISSSSGARVFLGFGDDDTTGIVDIEHGTWNIEHLAGAWYSLDGRRLIGKPSAKGVYIHNGRKEVVR